MSIVLNLAKKLLFIPLVILSSGLINAVTAAEGLQLVTGLNTPVESLSRAETASLFLGIGRNKVSLKPFDSSDAKLREEFYREVAGLSPARIRAHWAKNVFTGRGRPPKVVKLENVEQLLAGNPGAATYVPSYRIPKESKTLLCMLCEEGK